ncbi:MAG TPA: PAS domain-containing sensor histidine kinase [Longimicrobiales bacterium]|nr:PAS domain-containing sensor histidine kinase [Longimicrobiales bacterium]
MTPKATSAKLTADDYRAIFESSPDGCLVVDAQGTIRAANPRTEELFGWTAAELEGRTVEVLVPDLMRERHAEHRRRFRHNPHNRPMGIGLDLRGRRKDGTTFPVEISLSPFEHEGELRVICAIRDVTDYRRLQSFSGSALRATEEERQRIARELHDDTAQRLATLLLRVRRLAEEPDAGTRAALLEEVRGEIVDAAEGVKRMARGLRPPEIEELGLVHAITAHARALREGAGFRVHTALDPVDPHLDATAKLVLYRIVQEALSNARRHSGADSAHVRLFLENERVVAEITDEGRGFVPANAFDADGGGLGLAGMRERAAMMNGHVTIDSAPGKGTRVRVTVPCNAEER